MTADAAASPTAQTSAAEVRHEASVIPSYEKLTADQRVAGARVHDLIAQMARSTEKTQPARDFLPRTDQTHRNRVVLIDGGRGSGKTALLVTLLDVWRKAYEGGKESVPEDLRKWAEPWGRIVPIGHLDLH